MLYFALNLSRALNPRQTILWASESKSTMTLFCTIEYGSGEREKRCGRAAVAECFHCGASVCSSCSQECCGSIFCGYCYDYHAIHSCMKSSVFTDSISMRVAFHPVPFMMVCSISFTGWRSARAKRKAVTPRDSISAFSGKHSMATLIPPDYLYA